MIPNNITKEDIINAIEEIKKNNNIPPSRQAVLHLLEYNGITYPPKYVISIANKYANGEELNPDVFNGGPETNSFLINLGFNIIPKENNPSLNRKVWWVNQGSTFEKESAGGHIWAPLKKKDGPGTIFHWETLSELQKEDIVLNYSEGYIRCVSRVIETAINTRSPEASYENNWSAEGRLVKLEYNMLNPPIPLNKFNTSILELRINQGPINSANRVNQGYLFRFSWEGLAKIQECQPETEWPAFTKNGPVIRGKKSWLFQANPKLYDLKSAVKHLEEVNWRVTNYKDEIKIDDIIYLWEGGQGAGIVAIGTVIIEPSELPKEEKELPFIKSPEIAENTNLKVRIKINKVLDIPLSKNQLINNPKLNNMHILKAPMGSNFRITNEEDIELKRLMQIDKPRIAMTYSIDNFIDDTGFDREIIEGWRRRLLRKKHIVFQGPPGTGKTFVAQRLAKLIVSETEGFCDLVQFHPSYAYEDFMQGIRPNLTDGGQISYDLKDGRFVEFCQKAEKAPNSPCVLIIDEINRANLSRVFGELMYLLEYRNSEIPLSSGTNFKIPENVFIIGTMNTADRSIAVVDHALRRRFSFIRLNPEYKVLKKYLISKGYPGENLVNVLSEINKVIDDPNYEIGISYFMKKEDDLRVSLPEIWVSEIESYLEEYFYDKPSKVDSFRWDTLSKSKLSDWLSVVKSGN